MNLFRCGIIVKKSQQIYLSPSGGKQTVVYSHENNFFWKEIEGLIIIII